MRDLKNKLTSSKNTKNIQRRKGKSFGYQVLGFGAGGSAINPFIIATGGTITTVDTDYKVHTFTGPGTFTVVCAGTPDGADTVDYLVIAGGGSGGAGGGGGGGAGGYRESPGTASGSYTVSPLGASPAAALPVTAQGYSIAVGGGASPVSGSPGSGTKGNNGNNSSFSTITSTAGGGGGGSTSSGAPNSNVDGQAGGSGGGGSWDTPGAGGTALGGVGNTPPVSPAQGKNGGTGRHVGPSYSSTGGGGGALVQGTNQAPGTAGSSGGGGATSSINGTPTGRGGGGGGSGTPGAAGPGGGGSGGPPGCATAGSTNTGGGGGGGGDSVSTGAGGSGLVIIRYKFQQDKIMAHFAKISEENEVLTVLTLDNKDMLNADGVENESVGQEYLETHNNWPAHLWIQTSYNTFGGTHKDGGTAFRGNYAGIGYTWDEDDNIFWSKKPYTSWVKHLESASWKSPIGDAPTLTAEQTTQNTPADENTPATHLWNYVWNETNTTWDLTDGKA